VPGLQAALKESCLHLEFRLPPGAYATALLRELLTLDVGPADPGQSMP